MFTHKKPKISENSPAFAYMELLPPEILMIIFTFLTPHDLTFCRLVCSRWKRVVDSLTLNRIYWLKQCKRDYNSVYKSAYYKSLPEVEWCNVYRSLTLWCRLNDATEMRDEFASASSFSEEIRNFQVLRNGIIGVQTRSSIKYFDLKTLKQNNQSALRGSYSRYVENDNTIIILGETLTLYVIKKSANKAENNFVFDFVKTFILVDNKIYFVTIDDDLYVCDTNAKELKSELLKELKTNILDIGYYAGGITILTYHREVHKLVGKELLYVYNMNSSRNLLHDLQKYNFLDNMNWHVYFQWMSVLRQRIPNGLFRDIIIVKTYGDVVFLGTTWGVFRIYFSPYKNNELDLFNSNPVKQYNFMERWDCPVLSTCPILQIDVIEGIDSHKVLIAMPKKIALLTFNHNFRTAKSVALLPYKEAQGIQIVDTTNIQ